MRVALRVEGHEVVVRVAEQQGGGRDGEEDGRDEEVAEAECRDGGVPAPGHGGGCGWVWGVGGGVSTAFIAGV